MKKLVAIGSVLLAAVLWLNIQQPENVAHYEHSVPVAEPVLQTEIERGTGGTPDSSMITVQGIGAADPSTLRIVRTRHCTGVGPTWHCEEN